MNEPIKTDKAFCDKSSATISLKERGVAVTLAAENAASIAPTAKMAITSILAEIVESKFSTELFLMSGTTSAFKLLSARWAKSAAKRATATESTQNISGLSHSFSESLLKK